MIISPTAIDESSLCILLTYSIPLAYSLDIIQSLKLNTVLLHWHESFCIDLTQIDNYR